MASARLAIDPATGVFLRAAGGTSPARAAAVPPDVRLMNTVASVVGVLLVIALLAAAGAWAMRQPAFTLRAIQIDGDLGRNSVATIRANATPRLAGNFFTLDLQQAKAAFESVPWVRQAVVHRVWPDRLRVTLQEHQAVALWGSADGNDRLVNSFGEVFEANPGDVEDDALPRFSGPDGSAAHVLALYRRLAAVVSGMDARIETLSLSSRGSWTVGLDSGAELALGRGTDDEVLARSERFVRTLPQVQGAMPHPLEYADLRHGDGYAVRLSGVTTGPVASAPATGRSGNR